MGNLRYFDRGGNPTETVPVADSSSKEFAGYELGPEVDGVRFLLGVQVKEGASRKVRLGSFRETKFEKCSLSSRKSAVASNVPVGPHFDDEGRVVIPRASAFRESLGESSFSDVPSVNAEILERIQNALASTFQLS